MNKKEIEAQYDKLLDTADNLMLTEEDLELFDDNDIDAFLDLIDTDDPSKYFPSNNGIEINENTDPEQNVTTKVLLSSNPAAGLLTTIPYEEENITEESLDKLLELKDEELGQLEINWDNFVNTTKSMYDGADEEGLKQLFNAVNRYRTGEKFPYFNALPEFIKKEIDTFATAGLIAPQNNNEVKRIRNMMAKELFDTIIANNYSTKAFADISKFSVNEINKEKEKLGGSIHEYNTKLREEYEVGFLKKADELESEGDIEKAEKFRKVSRMFTQSYTYEDMYELYSNRRIKVKSIQVEKITRTCQEFNRKYYNNTLKINDIGMTISVLDRVLDQKYNINAIKKFIVIFINYTKNFLPSNIDEHVFMYYFVQHILALDVKIPDDAQNEFNDLLISNISKFLDLIIKKDEEKEELKKGSKENAVST